MGEKFFGFDIDNRWDYENGFYLTSHPGRLSKMLAHFELYKSIIGLPGHIVECGVYRGASLIRFATFREILENPYSRKIIGFDAFGKFPEYQNQDLSDTKIIEKFKQTGDGIPVDELKKVFNYKPFDNFELIQGDIMLTVPQYLNSHPEFRIALLHIDVDVYKPSAVILNSLYDRIVKRGVLVLDDYGRIAGETKAVDEFFEGKDVLIEKLPIANDNPAYIRK